VRLGDIIELSSPALTVQLLGDTTGTGVGRGGEVGGEVAHGNSQFQEGERHGSPGGVGDDQRQGTGIVGGRASSLRGHGAGLQRLRQCGQGVGEQRSHLFWACRRNGGEGVATGGCYSAVWLVSRFTVLHRGDDNPPAPTARAVTVLSS
jgi:hypothetical protein